MPRLILVRHGQSVWNASNRFTGWTDVDLSDQGVEEAEEAGRELSKIKIDVVHTSDLVRAQRTADIIMRHNEASEEVPTKFDW
ncbi:MAG: 2,3-bisphosphoglycerate-dependent phosphoglycerate mutase, partial [Candidatus Thalassarchaeaceae archaeon]|nr:2,3-bisphosphoglycerate-dependent phosphoglycerate mutase [Candidatus Thalassarchaeaceae archaeon]